MSWIALGGSLFAIVLLAGVAWAIRLGRGSGRIDAPEDAMRDAGHALSGFNPVAAVVAEDGAAALVVGRDARVAVLKAHGARVAAREVKWSAVRSTQEGIVVETGERRFGRVPLAGVDALHVRQLVPAGASALLG